MKLCDKTEWREDMCQPLQITAQEIMKDLRAFSNGFPKDRIPHCSENEKAAQANNLKLIRALKNGELIKSELLELGQNENDTQYAKELRMKQRDEQLASIHSSLLN